MLSGVYNRIMIMIILPIIAAICLLIIVLGFYANSTLFFREKCRPADPEPEKCFDPKTQPVALTAPGRQKAVILVHGFPSSPSAYRKAGELYFKAGYDVFIPLLPGFGTSPDDFVKTNFSQWFDYLCRFYEEKRTAYPQLYVNGTSMGGSLTLKLAERYSNTEKAPDAVVTAAAPVFLNKIRLGIMRQPGMYIIKLIAPFVSKIAAGINNGKPQGGVNGDEEWRGYTGLYPKQTYSLYMNLKRIEKDLKKITVPILMMHSKKDRTVPFGNLFYIAARLGTPEVTCRIIDSGDFNYTHHCLFMYDTLRERLVNETVAFFEEVSD